MSDAPGQFEACVAFTYGQEGGYSNTDGDPGGATNLGITLATLTEWRGEPCTADDVRALAKSEADAIYRADYWAVANCDALPPGMDLMVFDEAVNAGPARSVMLLQETLGVYPDGALGPDTLAALAGKDTLRAIGSLAGAQRAYYMSRPGFAQFGRGWLARLTLRQALAMQMAKSP